VVWCGVRDPGLAPASRDPNKGVDVLLASPPRRALGLLAASTIGLSTALLGVTGVAQAAPTLAPLAPAIDRIQGGDTTLVVTADANHPAEDDLDTAWADTWQYQLDGGSWLTAADAQFDAGSVTFELTGLTNGDDYSVRVRGVDDDLGAGAESEPATGTPFKKYGTPVDLAVTTAPGTLTAAWSAPTTAGTYALAGYKLILGYSGPDSSGAREFCDTTALTCTATVQSGLEYTVNVVAYDVEGNVSDPVQKPSGVIPFPATVPAKTGDLVLPAGASSSVAPGATVTVSGSGYQPGSKVTVFVYSEPQLLTTTVADGSGNFTVTVTVPAGLAPGSHTLVAAGIDTLGNPRYFNLAVTVTADGVAKPAVTGAAKLAVTGADVTGPAIGGLAALALGGGLIVVARRRRAA
jgi:hypothetical protein